MSSEVRRVNITISGPAHDRLRAMVDNLYGGNFSRFIADAALFYAGVLNDAGRQDVEAYVVKRQAQTVMPHVLHEKGSQVGVLICSYCGNPDPQQLDSLSADTVNIICPHCGNEQVLKGFRVGGTWIPPKAAVQALRNYYSGERPGALDPQSIQLVKRHFADRRYHRFSDEEWSERISNLEAERKQLNQVRRNLAQTEKEV